MYAEGKDIPKNDVEAFRLLKLAAEQGNARAQFTLGLGYAYGKGVPENIVEAYAWINIAVAQGVEDSLARHNLELRMTNTLMLRLRNYRKSIGKPTDLATAIVKS